MIPYYDEAQTCGINVDQVMAQSVAAHLALLTIWLQLNTCITTDMPLQLVILHCIPAGGTSYSSWKKIEPINADKCQFKVKLADFYFLHPRH